MKKVIATAAGLLLVGAMAGAALAEVNLSGDARVRWIYKDKYDFGNSDQDATNYFDSRIRVKFDAKAKGGAFMKARLRFDDYKWDGQGWGAYSEDKNVWVDYAWIGVPMGPVTVEGGRMIGSFSKFFAWDGRPTRLKLTYKSGGFKLIGLLDVKDDFVNDYDDFEDNNFRQYAIVAANKFSDNWSGKFWLSYQNDDREYNDDGTLRVGDSSGYKFAVHVDGKVGGMGIAAEYAYKEADTIGSVDDGWGAYVELTYKMGALTPSVNIGVTRDGYVADNDFGWIMIGAAEPITVTDVGESQYDWFWIAPSVKYAVSDRFSLAGNFVWVNVDTNDNAPIDSDRLAKAYEVSASAKYVISDGADFTVKMGWLKPDFDGRIDGIGVQDDAAFGAYGRLAIKF